MNTNRLASCLPEQVHYMNYRDGKISFKCFRISPYLAIEQMIPFCLLRNLNEFFSQFLLSFLPQA